MIGDQTKIGSCTSIKIATVVALTTHNPTRRETDIVDFLTHIITGVVQDARDATLLHRYFVNCEYTIFHYS